MTYAVDAERVDNSNDVIDVRDVIARVECLRLLRENDSSDDQESEDYAELTSLESLLSDLCGNGGDEQWEGDWYPVTLVRDSYFKDYAQELAEDCGMIPDNAAWPCRCIDWDQAAHELQTDYSATEYNGVAYWFR